jgi:HEAT repeat protein
MLTKRSSGLVFGTCLLLATAIRIEAGQEGGPLTIEEMADTARTRLKERETELKAKILFELGNLKSAPETAQAQKSVKALVALGVEAVPSLLEALKNPSDHVRRNTSLVLKTLLAGSESPALRAQVRAVVTQKDHPGRAEALSVLEGTSDPETLALVRTVLSEEGAPAALRVPALQHLARAGTPADGTVALPHLKYDNPQVRRAALAALGALKATGGLPEVLKALDDSESSVAQEAFKTLGAWKEPKATQKLLEIMENPNEERALQAIRTLGELGDAAAIPRIKEKLRSTSAAVVEESAYALASLKDLSGEGPLTAPERAALKKNPRSPEPHETLGKKLKKLGDCSGNLGLYKKAVQEYKTALDQSGQRQAFTLLVELAACYARLQDYKTAAATLRKTQLEEFFFLKEREDFAEMMKDAKYKRMFDPGAK